MRTDSVVITGAGMVTSLGRSPGETWRALLEGNCGIGPIRGFDTGGFRCRLAAQVRDFDPTRLDFRPRHERIMDLQFQMLWWSAREALRVARLEGSSVPGEEIGFFSGMGMVDYKIEDLLPAIVKSMDAGGGLDLTAFYEAGYREIHPLFTLSLLNNISFSQVAIDLGIRGENAVFSPHADSGALAIAEGALTVVERKAKIVLAGGVSEKINPMGLARAHLAGPLGCKDESEASTDRGFPVAHSGTVMGEGCGILCLEPRTSADRRNARYGAMIAGYGAAFGIEEGSGVASCEAIAGAMRGALESAELGPADVDVLIVHGDGNPMGDKNEIEAIHQVFAPRIDELFVFSSKGALGHLLAAAPAVDSILATWILQESLVPQTLDFKASDGNVGFCLVSGGAQRVPAKRVLVNCRSDEGQCASLIIEAVG